MADYDFPPLLQGEGPTLDAASILQAQNAGEWARTFGEHGAGKNNLMTRKRHNADIARETEANQQMQEQHQINELKTNKGALDLYVRGKTLDMNMKLGRANLDRIAQQVDAKEQMLPLEMEAKKAATNAALAREKSTIAATAMKAKLEQDKDNDTAAFVEEIQRSTAKRGTPEFAEAVANARLKYRAMDHGLFQDVWKTHTGSEIEPEEAIKRLEAVLPGAAVTAKMGGVTATVKPSTEPKELQSRLTHLESLSTRNNLDEAQKAYFKGEIDKVKAQMGGGAGFADSAIKPATERIATNPKTGAKMVFRNGAWQPLTQ